jgi:hypothetical protein
VAVVVEMVHLVRMLELQVVQVEVVEVVVQQERGRPGKEMRVDLRLVLQEVAVEVQGHLEAATELEEMV